MVSGDLERRIGEWEADSSLAEPDRLRERIEVLDELDALFGDVDGQTAAAEADLCVRAGALRATLEAVNAAIYGEIRAEVQQGKRPEALLRWMEICRERAGAGAAGLEPERLGGKENRKDMGRTGLVMTASTS